MRTVVLFLTLSIWILACRPAKNVQKIEQAVSRVDSNPQVVVKDTQPKDVRSAAQKPATAIFNSIIKNEILFQTFNARVRVEFKSKEGGDEATAFVRMKKDSAIWLSLRGALGIEGFRVIITKDSVKVMNLLKKNVQFRNIGYLQEITGLPFDFANLQDLVVGNPIFIDSNVISYKVNEDNQLQVLMGGRFFKHLVTLDNANFHVLHSRLDDIDVSRKRTCEITFSDYEKNSGVAFSKSRKISFTLQSKLDVDVDFKQYSFNQPLTFPFNIPKNYERL